MKSYTLGKVLETILYNEYFVKDKVLIYCGFQHPHPHIPLSYLRIAFNEEPESMATIVNYLVHTAEQAIEIFDAIKKEF